jgi:hypothetical protein
MRRAIFATILCLASALCPVDKTDAKSGAVKPSLVNLTLSDMPAGFTPANDQLMDNTHAARDSNKTVAELNRIGLVLTSNRQFNNTKKAQLLMIAGQVRLFSTTANAQADYHRRLKSPMPLSKGDKESSLPTPRIGAQSAAWLVTIASQGIPVQIRLIMFFDGPYEVAVEAAEMPGTSDEPTVVAMAKTIDKRIQAHM